MKIDELIELLESGSERGNEYDDALMHKAAETIRVLNAVPAADVVEVVRCKDCKHRLERNGKFECIYDTGDPFAQGREADNDKWFCADGEKREVQDGA